MRNRTETTAKAATPVRVSISDVQRFAPDQSEAAHDGWPPPRSVAMMRRRARPFKMNVIRKSTRPSSMSALRYKSPLASEN